MTNLGSKIIKSQILSLKYFILSLKIYIPYNYILYTYNKKSTTTDHFCLNTLFSKTRIKKNKNEK